MANKRLYVGNIPWTSTEEDVKKHFGGFAVEEVKIITDRDTGKSRGFCFVTLDSPEAAALAMKQLHQSDLGGRTIVVNEAEDKKKGGGNRNGGGRQHRRDDRRGGSDDNYGWDKK